MAWLKSEDGFTYVSLIVMITVILIFVPLLASLVNSVKFSSHYDEFAINQFFIFLRNELIEGTDYDVTSQKITLYLQDGRRASFELYNNLIVRRIDGGFEVYLRDVKEVSFISLSYGIQVVITSMQGDQYEKTIVFYQ